MKPVFARIPEDLSREAFALREIDLPYFSTEFHFHKECQLVYVVESDGRRIIGDSVESFYSDELILLGPDIPHVWHNDKQYFETGGLEKHARSIALFFDPEKLLGALAPLTPLKHLELTLQQARRGMKFKGTAKERLRDLLFNMAALKELERLSCLIAILHTISHTPDYELLASEGYINTYQSTDNDRIHKVFKYVFDNFSREIALDEVCSLVNMNKQAFCRYFKSRTQKTFVHFVNEVRISQACKLLSEGEQPIASLAYDCGFNSLSNFNRIFRESRGVTPREYKKSLSA
ncbi:AraC family transcriptional regulator [Flavihumibacter petaseus]|uniref:Putative AraC family transcriptional regulator n=1 Tax=Flavihumibacter petaseus NBRC 106054 TaxID=1220578 RepID=A0A0E9MZ22_9BACT|nr:AraC family transcriptional regulator [Flavihumibacter petaseus]GAO42783.1 putative AraC family transcriptional regulator [Flavihumibacter petaseus NBRC 106054]